MSLALCPELCIKLSIIQYMIYYGHLLNTGPIDERSMSAFKPQQRKAIEVSENIALEDSELLKQPVKLLFLIFMQR